MFKMVWKWFLQGIALIAPVAITIALLVWLGDWAEDTFGALMQSLLPAGWYFKGMGVLAGFLITLAVGLLANVFLVRWVLKTTERVLNSIPLVKSLFQAFKDIAGLFSKEDGDQLGQVVAVDVNGLRLVGFVMQHEARMPGLEDDDRVAVYMPMSYQIGGYTMHVQRSQVTPLKVSPDVAMRAVLTGGSLVTDATPDDSNKSEDK